MRRNGQWIRRQAAFCALLGLLMVGTASTYEAAGQKDEGLARGLGGMLAAYARQPSFGLVRGATRLVEQMNDPSDPAVLAAALEVALGQGAGNPIGTLLAMAAEAEAAGLGSALANLGLLPEQLRGAGLLETGGIVYSGTLAVDTPPPTMGQRIRVITEFTTLGFLRDLGAGNVYEHIQTLGSPVPLLIQFVNRSETTDLVMTLADVLVIVLPDGTPVPISIGQDIDVPKNSTSDVLVNFANFWIDTSGRLYLNELRVDEHTTGPFSFSQAVINGVF